ncbi:Translation Initiation factor eIF-4e family and Translation Initiation factor eIF-4e-like domain-containing protein [Strongyloides ratti]|uniref:eIF-4F 25 kDa subunit n=1 Tax=Strongyloides ratti TaxID=34506 RepID=A0A090L0R7_STRRB|nr:Translation Initiation factor eIF-4e family and Translation Initiation factor eIF-4e-like domain-containing protein [Strongyloides ratti]CEF63261.1 Translation Initiation factor eIF-4e family and Translation Initiation factor eIF-4e-like domain-containing protein [Strongyloides ratti]
MVDNNSDVATAKQNQEVKLPTEVSISNGKHKLTSRWCLWYLKGDRNKEWEDCLKMVSTFDTVEDFWALYHHIQLASGLNWGSDYYLFKEGIKPMWEDANNVKGGRWLVVVDKSKRAAKLDHYWIELMMAIIGEQFENYGPYICGAVVNIRQKGDKVSLWTRDASRDDINLRIGQILKEKLEIPDNESIRYEVHKDSSNKTGSMVKPRIVLPEKLSSRQDSKN